MTYSKLLDINGHQSLSFDCGDLPADSAIRDAGHEPNGYFWEGIVVLVVPNLAEALELDSESGMFSATGRAEVLASLQTVLEPILGNPAAILALIDRAAAEGFTFDD